ncbi:uncharacterized protein yc1106_02353 [Curvularia clavata]|uniref:Uncharacterized protein n=1 Tax=Curvularia clavata TaxID=95742 RepID=A0A9Q8Z572_CURCL|nr:uncharacterized protein yc1106_02353 [Curvularia clavata]
MSTDERGFDLPLQPSQLNLYMNLPPPPPPPQSNIPPLVRAETPVEQLGELTEGRRAQEFYEIEKQHDKIMAAREDLTGYRSQMKTEREKIRKIREQTGAQEGSVINQLRTFLHKQNITLSREIEETFEQTDALRDQLGLLEAEYDDFEQDYTMKEVEHTGKEMHFIEKLRSVHSRCPAASTSMQAQINVDIVDGAPLNPTRDWEVFKQSNEVPDATSSEKALQLCVQTKVDPEAQEIDERQATNIVLFANKPNVDNWLVNTIFQSPITQASLEESDQDDLMEKALQDWHCLGTIGAQFKSEELEGYPSRPKEKQDSVLSSSGIISCDEPVLVLHTKEFRQS